MDIDEKDLVILDSLKENSKLTTQQISKKTRIAVTTVHNRIKKLEKLGIIEGYGLKLDHKKLGYGITAYILISVSYNLPSGRKVEQFDICNKIKVLDGVESVNIVAGVSDIVVKVRTKDVDELNGFVTKHLRKIEGVDKTQTMVVLNEI